MTASVSSCWCALQASDSSLVFIVVWIYYPLEEATNRCIISVFCKVVQAIAELNNREDADEWHASVPPTADPQASDACLWHVCMACVSAVASHGFHFGCYVRYCPVDSAPACSP